MEIEILNKSCCRNTSNVPDTIEKSSICPVCGQPGSKVKNITVKHLVLDEFIEKVGDSDYYLCMDRECEVAYYIRESDVKFNKQQVKVSIWFKKGANPKYACYCSKVTEKQVVNAVVKDGAKIMGDVLRITGAMGNPQCQKNNPLGKCCHQIVQEAIDKGLSVLNQTGNNNLSN